MTALIRIVLALVSGALLAQVYGLHPLWPLAWIAPAPLLFAAIGANKRTAALCGAIAGALSMALMIAYFLRIGGVVPLAIITLVKMVLWAGFALAVRGAAKAMPAWAALLVFPALMAGVETLIAATSPHSTAGSLAYSQMNFTPAIQIAALGGAPAVTFVVCLFASALAFAAAKRTFVTSGVAALIALATLAVHPWSTSSPSETRSVKVAMLAADSFDLDAPDWRLAWEAYAVAAERAARDGADIIVLPEKIVAIPEGDAELATQRFANIALQFNTVIVVGVVTSGGHAQFNTAWVIAPEGFRNYDKRHMVPGFEDQFTVGTSDVIVEHDGLRLGVAICKDMDFPDLARGYGRAGVDLMLVPAWDFQMDDWLHSRMAILRGVENGFSIVRSARNGVVTISDPRGAVTSESSSTPDVLTVVEEVQLHTARTLYTRIGDIFGWLCLALAALLIGWSVFARVRAGQGGQNAD